MLRELVWLVEFRWVVLCGDISNAVHHLERLTRRFR